LVLLKNVLAGFALSLLLLSFGATAYAAATQEVTLQFQARAGDRLLRCGTTYDNIGRTHASITLQDFRIYVSNVRLIARDGREQALALTPDGAWQSDRVALLDFEDASGNCNGNAPTNTSIHGRVPAGDYVGLAFDIGVPDDLDHQDTTIAAPPLNVSALTWPWRYGYKFTTIDFGILNAPPARANAASGFSIHLGSVDCGDGSPSTPPQVACATPNRPTYRFGHFNASRQVVVLDLAALVADTDVTVNAPDTAPGCMSGDDADCTAIMSHFGLGGPSHVQSFVRIGER
jgi:uncharacterized repeat protein (TIGR04052 family)